GASWQWQSLALFTHSSPTGTTDPVLGQDVSFYLLTLPFLRAATNWALGLDLMAVLLIGALYSWRGDSFDFRPAPRAHAHVAVVQGVSATPNAGTYELPYIAREIDYTRRAYGLSDVTGNTGFTGDQPLTLQDVQNDQVTVNNLRLWDYGPLKDTYQQQQAIRTYYTFNDIDLDRYTVNGQYQQLEISAREFEF